MRIARPTKPRLTSPTSRTGRIKHWLRTSPSVSPVNVSALRRFTVYVHGGARPFLKSFLFMNRCASVSCVYTTCSVSMRQLAALHMPPLQTRGGRGTGQPSVGQITPVNAPARHPARGACPMLPCYHVSQPHVKPRALKANAHTHAACERSQPNVLVKGARAKKTAHTPVPPPCKA